MASQDFGFGDQAAAANGLDVNTLLAALAGQGGLIAPGGAAIAPLLAGPQAPPMAPRSTLGGAGAPPFDPSRSVLPSAFDALRGLGGSGQSHGGGDIFSQLLALFRGMTGSSGGTSMGGPMDGLGGGAMGGGSSDLADFGLGAGGAGNAIDLTSLLEVV